MRNHDGPVLPGYDPALFPRQNPERRLSYYRLPTTVNKNVLRPVPGPVFSSLYASALFIRGWFYCDNRRFAAADACSCRLSRLPRFPLDAGHALNFDGHVLRRLCRLQCGKGSAFPFRHLDGIAKPLSAATCRLPGLPGFGRADRALARLARLAHSVWR